MIRLYDGQITDLLLNEARYDPEVMSLSYAILHEKRRLMDKANGTRTLAVIDELPEKVLDLLSVELRTPAYDEQFPIKTKRALIKGALSFYAKLGTPDAVNWLIGAIFGDGKIEEWFDYGGTPYYFRVSVRKSGSLTDIDSLYQFFRLIGRVKRLSSHLESVIINADPAQAPLHIGVRGAIISRLTPTEQPDNLSGTQTLRASGQFAAIARQPPSEQPDNLSGRQTLRAAGQPQAVVRLLPAQQADNLTATQSLRTGGRVQTIASPAPAQQPDKLSATRIVRASGRPAIVHVLRGRQIEP